MNVSDFPDEIVQDRERIFSHETAYKLMEKAGLKQNATPII
jgi:hypothetical protein